MHKTASPFEYAITPAAFSVRVKKLPMDMRALQKEMGMMKPKEKYIQWGLHAGYAQCKKRDQNKFPLKRKRYL